MKGEENSPFITFKLISFHRRGWTCLKVSRVCRYFFHHFVNRFLQLRVFPCDNRYLGRAYRILLIKLRKFVQPENLTISGVIEFQETVAVITRLPVINQTNCNHTKFIR